MSLVSFCTTYGLTILSIIATIISIVIALIKAKTSGNNKGMIAIIEKIPSLVTTAESLFGKGKGTAKLDYVLTQLRLYALQNDIKIDVEDLTAQVNSVVATTNNVNVDKVPNPVEDSTTGGEPKGIALNTQDTINI